MAIDGNSIANRAFYGIRHLSASDGTPTNAVYGFLSILQKLIDAHSPDALCVAFDLPAPTFRHERYREYKATRRGMPDDLAVQMPILKELLDAMNIPRYELSGWEADDLLGTFSKRCQASDWECVIVTGDKDAFQLITDKTRVMHIKTRAGQTETINFTTDAFREEYGFEPIRIIDLKALMGDSSDNIPGVPGVGEKTALDLVRRFGRMSEIYNTLGEIDIKDTLKAKLSDNRELAELSYELATIRTDAPIDFLPEENLRKDPKNDELYGIFKRLRFSSFIDKYRLRPPSVGSGSANTVAAHEIVSVTTSTEAYNLLALAKDADVVTVQVDTNFFDSAAVILPGKPQTYTLQKGVVPDFEKTLGELLSGAVKKAGHDVKDIIRACLKHGIDTDGWIFDSALAAYLISPTDSNYTLPRISDYYCGFSPGGECPDGPGGSGGCGQMSMLLDGSVRLSKEAFAVFLLQNTLGAKLKELNLEKLYGDIEMPLCKVLAQMENSGFLIDKAALTRFGADLSVLIDKTEAQIFDQAHEKFNINSPKQLGIILFEKLMLPAPKKTKTGYSTNIEVLDGLLGKHPIINLLKDYRELTKLKSTYADGLLKVIGSDGRIHTHFQMTVTATGRLSSTEPNLQNIPVRKEMGGELRKMFISGEGNVLVGADYSQIELRLLAHIARDPTMIRAFKNGEDIHTVTASQVFDVPVGEITATYRNRAKAVNFGIVYGISPFSLGNDIGVTPKEAKAYIDSYLEKYSGVREYMREVVASAKQKGYVSTLFNRRRDMPELKSSNFNTRSFGERVALNMPIQGTAADIMKIAMINVSRRLEAENLSARLILQVHDELIAECPFSEAEKAAEIMREEMENAAALSVPLIAQTRIGRSWHDTK
ncbi:MAG: DNA polymerase I [Oscillospiraceae bacterium]|nr:DNA polymerase I [Oscillospiraceae bacterium]